MLVGIMQRKEPMFNIYQIGIGIGRASERMDGKLCITLWSSGQVIVTDGRSLGACNLCIMACHEIFMLIILQCGQSGSWKQVSVVVGHIFLLLVIS